MSAGVTRTSSLEMCETLSASDLYERPAQAREFCQPWYVKALGMRDPAGRVAYGNDLCAELMRKNCDEPAYVAEALDRDAGAFQCRAAIFQELFRNENDAATGRSFSTLAAVQVERFAGHNGRRKSVDLRVPRPSPTPSPAHSCSCLGPGYPFAGRFLRRGAARICGSFALPRLRKAPLDPRRFRLWHPRKVYSPARFSKSSAMPARGLRRHPPKGESAGLPSSARGRNCAGCDTRQTPPILRCPSRWEP